MDAKNIALIKALGGGGSGGSGGSITVDNALSATSTNPVQNRVVKSALDALKIGGTSLSMSLRSALYNLLMDAVYQSTGHESDKEALEELLTGESGGGSETTYYTITKNLTNVTISNGAASVAAGSEYSATLTADDGYTLDGASVSISVNGEDITDTAYADGVITIQSVTGNVVISATACKEASDEVTLLKSIITDGSAWIDTGFIYDKSKYRLEFGFEFPELTENYYYMGVDAYNVGSAYKQFYFWVLYSSGSTREQYFLFNGKQSNINYTNGSQVFNTELHHVWNPDTWKLYLNEGHTSQPTYPWYKDVTFDTSGADDTTLPINSFGLFKPNCSSNVPASAVSAKQSPIAGTKCLYFRAYDIDTDELVVDLRPAMLGNVVGMYNTVSSEFIGPKDGTFTYEEVPA